MAKKKLTYENEISYDIILEEEDIPEYDVLVAGFPGTGLIGGIASEQLINTLDLEQVASIDCEEFPPTAVIFDGIPRRPVRFFAGEKFLLVKSDMIIPPNLTASLAETIIDFALDREVEEVIIFDGIPDKSGGDEEEKEKKIWGVLSSHSAKTEAEKLDIEVISRGAVSGISSSLLLHANEKEIQGIGMLVEGNPNMPDPRASATLLERFSEYRDIDIEIESLLESAEQLEEQYAQMVDQANKAQSDMERKSAHPPLYG
ncbi:MAG: proteasome assembly chaperone family protein [Candidatus Natronoplasma sp.]